MKMKFSPIFSLGLTLNLLHASFSHELRGATSFKFQRNNVWDLVADAGQDDSIAIGKDKDRTLIESPYDREGLPTDTADDSPGRPHDGKSEDMESGDPPDFSRDGGDDLVPEEANQGRQDYGDDEDNDGERFFRDGRPGFPGDDEDLEEDDQRGPEDRDGFGDDGDSTFRGEFPDSSRGSGGDEVTDEDGQERMEDGGETDSDTEANSSDDQLSSFNNFEQVQDQTSSISWPGLMAALAALLCVGMVIGNIFIRRQTSNNARK